MLHDVSSFFLIIYDNSMIQSITQLRKISLSQLIQQARKIGIDNAGNLKHSELLFEYIKQKMTKSGEQTLE